MAHGAVHRVRPSDPADPTNDRGTDGRELSVANQEVDMPGISSRPAPLRVIASFAMALTPFSSAASQLADTRAALIGREAATTTTSQIPHREIIDLAKRQLGVPYSYGGTTPAGFDCSGFTGYVFRHFGVELPRSSSQIYSLGGTRGYKRIADRSDLLPGDLVFQSTGGDAIGHVAIYIGNGRFIGATSANGIKIDRIYDRYYWGPRWVGGIRLAPSLFGKRAGAH